jgi:hypothetical protein
MKKQALIALLGMSLFCAGCEKRPVPETASEPDYGFAAVYAPDGRVVHAGILDSREDHDDATVDLRFRDGLKFLSHSMNVVMSNKPLDAY